MGHDGTRENRGGKTPGRSFGSTGRQDGRNRRGTGKYMDDRPSRPARSNSASGKADKTTRKAEEQGLVRLNRFIAASGVCSRREADEIIKRGEISVNGKPVTDMGTKVNRTDDVRYKGKKLSSEKLVYVLLNKPKDYVTTVEDPHADKTVIDLVGKEVTERIYPVGRLDKSTTGVLLLTNDGELAGRLMHPRYKRKKIYHVWLDRDVTWNDINAIAEGIDLEGEVIAADSVAYADENDKSQVGIEIHSGQNRVVRRIFEKLGYKVKKLDRVYFAGLTKKNLPRGKWRFLSDKEIAMLKRGIF